MIAFNLREFAGRLPLRRQSEQSALTLASCSAGQPAHTRKLQDEGKEFVRVV